MESDDQNDEELSVAHTVLNWMECQKTNATRMTHRQRFSQGNLLVALKISQALDQQSLENGIDSVNQNTESSALVVDFLDLYQLSGRTWMLGFDLWGPTKRRGEYEFDDLQVDIPKKLLGKRKSEENRDTGSETSPGRHHSNRPYRLFGEKCDHRRQRTT